MDPARFDTITRALGQARSRRGVLRTVGGTLGAAGLALLGREEVRAASCSSDADCIDGRCVNGHCRFGIGAGGLGRGEGHRTCDAPGTICLHNRECCSGRCTLNSVDPPRGRCA